MLTFEKVFEYLHLLTSLAVINYWFPVKKVGPNITALLLASLGKLIVKY